MIYFIRGKESGNIKIGFSINPDKRKSNLQTAHYEELEFIGIMNGSLDDEARIKKMFSEFNIRGEWYRPVREVMDYVKKNANKPKMNIVSSLGNDEYRIILAEPIKYTMNFFLLAGTHNMRVLSDKELEMVFGIEGKKKVLLSWLESLQVVTKEAMDEFESLMTD
ncbi:MAG: GIY-YIG nuclease family protein [Anaerolineales bacterium]|nr:GIY-YIG nuclease family protein [Anaerolineales bacterium]